ncbi:MAG: hypothetical protein COZ06_28590 [Armatimonadetes bacterium CG_4_10_14_3_um_filter_66_18]|nr:hypothetical protein [Armatimonadota bacterium]OIO93818.1 MAG: hypothetical protein AUJ96_29655 [Armatimonadetes bacterium CG2_30_66_41]PIU92760.1 MAG: hypothetical protein COS65_16035 [Armatimonadetes bacterium CG06_land_8_20_14_3_00_66_21]PIX44733.1 MAG: hypothetical protein COZ57_16950 [Armatimonadetes bacterium CG_4_8_14_3_um_filter_66_20]PIY40115.1 MAG: hypothetical protein COZ06_28590 [Armatimonadetes bacterium CG_4_10_14_3_um_filter_66_18]PIZ41713.1 MAG: hypothetical protein COY42_18
MAPIALDFAEHLLQLPGGTHTGIPVLRLRARLRFLKADGSPSPAWLGTVDTGAPVSVIPRILWQPLARTLVHENTTFGGISKQAVCQIPASLAEVQGLIIDSRGHASRCLTFPAYLAHTDEVPLLIGFASLLSVLALHVNCQKRQAWVRELD